MPRPADDLDAEGLEVSREHHAVVHEEEPARGRRDGALGRDAGEAAPEVDDVGRRRGRGDDAGQRAEPLQRLLHVADPLRVLGPQARPRTSRRRPGGSRSRTPSPRGRGCGSCGRRARWRSGERRPLRSPRPRAPRTCGASRGRAWSPARRASPPASRSRRDARQAAHEPGSEPDHERHADGREEDGHVDPHRVVELAHGVAGGVAGHAARARRAGPSAPRPGALPPRCRRR